MPSALAIDPGLTCNFCSAQSFTQLFTKRGFAILKCAGCNIVFTKIPRGLDLLSIYDESYFQGGQTDGYGDYRGTEAIRRRQFQSSLRQIRRLTNWRSGLRLLEIGSAYGFFLDEARRYFECTGVEVSQPAAEYSRQRGHRVIDEPLTEATLPRVGKVDIVTMFDVVEHLADPVATFRLVDRSLNTDGVIVLTTGDIDSLNARMCGKHWRMMTPPQHTYFFSRQTLCSLFERMNYKIEVMKRPWKVVPIGLAAYKIGKRMGIRLRSLENLNVFVPVNLGDTVLIAARKQ